MSDELRLPDDLAAVEARLAAEPLAAMGINRDELMYRAGWAACEARLAGDAGGPVRLAGGSRGMIAAWSLASAATAATLAAVLTLQWRPAERQVAIREARTPVYVAAEAIAAEATAVAQRVAKPARLSNRPSQFGIGALALRRQILSSAWEQPNSMASAHGVAPPAAKTVRELMQEMLPSESVSSTRFWPWVNAPRGEAI